MRCSACQAEIEANSVYCPKCGARLEEPEVPGAEENSGAEEVSGAEETQEPDSEDVEERAEFPAQRTASERLLEAARSGGEKTTEAKAGTAWTGGGYSPKALNAWFYNVIAVTVLLLAFSLWLMWKKEWTTTFGLYPSLIVIAALWIWFACIRIYRVWTIKYQLTAHQFYHEQGIFKRVRDVIEVIDIDDLKLERTLFDRIVNGGVGTVTIKSADQSTPELKLVGLDNPDVVFQSLDNARRKERAARGLKSV